VNDILNVSDVSIIDNDGTALIIDLCSGGIKVILNNYVTANENTR